MPTSLTGYDLIITSYGTLIRDKEIFENLPLLCVIGDEAQYLKEPKNSECSGNICPNLRGAIYLIKYTRLRTMYMISFPFLNFFLPGSCPEIPSSSRGEERIWHEQSDSKRGCSVFIAEKKVGSCTRTPR